MLSVTSNKKKNAIVAGKENNKSDKRNTNHNDGQKLRYYAVKVCNTIRYI